VRKGPMGCRAEKRKERREKVRRRLNVGGKGQSGTKKKSLHLKGALSAPERKKAAKRHEEEGEDTPYEKGAMLQKHRETRANR